MKATTTDPDCLLIPRRELQFLLYDWLDLEGLLRRPLFSHVGRETVDAVLELSARVAADTLLTVANARLITTFGSQAQVEQFAIPQIQGRWLGTMCLSEPQAGSSLADVRTAAPGWHRCFAEGALALCLYCAKLVDDGDADADAVLALLTPVAKTWSAEYGCAANDLAIQVHSGYGYTRDFDVEQLYRDNRLNPIHEGTTSIQAIDLLDRKMLRASVDGLRRAPSTAILDNATAFLAAFAGHCGLALRCGRFDARRAVLKRGSLWWRTEHCRGVRKGMTS